MITLEVKADFAALKGKIDQIPFATALALTRTAQDAQAEVRRGLKSRFTVRNNFVEKGILFSAAKKDTLQATVFSRDDFMILQEKGGTKTPRGASISVPMEGGNKKGIARAGRRPKDLRSTVGVFRAKIGGVDGLWQRLQRRSKAKKAAGHHLKLLFVFKPSVPVRARFGFADTVRKVVIERFRRQLDLAIATAVRTAR